jgi:hypothetical protein
MRQWRLTAAAGAAALLAGCGTVQIAPQPVFPKPLVEQLPATVGLVLPAEQRDFRHEETRGGVAWAVLLGAGQQAFARTVMGASFREVREFPDRAAAAQDPALQAVFEPHIEQYSFATADETGGEYVAVTIRYRIEVLAPDGSAHDTLSLTGYGTSRMGGMEMGSSDSMDRATRAAMRDAAAKFLAQFGRLPMAARLAAGERLAGDATGQRAAAASPGIDALPVRGSRRPAPPPVTPAAP